MTEPPPQPDAALEEHLFCQECGYNLRSLTSSRCPECGRSLEGMRGLVSRIPWANRKETGWFRAYWKTVLFVMFRQGEFCDEMARPVSFGDSQRFRWLTILFALAPVLIADLVLWIEEMPSPVDDEVIVMFWNSIGLSAVLHISFALFLAGATGVPSCFFHPRGASVEQQNRAIALSYYACGPLSLLILPTIAAMYLLHVGLDGPAGMLAMLLMLILPLALLVVWWVDLIHLARRLMPQRPQRAVGVAVLVPLLWLLLLGLCFVFLPAVVVYVRIFIASFGVGA